MPCGYARVDCWLRLRGLPLGAELVKQGHEVFGLRRSPGAEAELKSAGIKPLLGDITQPGQLARLPASYDWVVNCVSASGGGAAEYREVYLEGTRNLIAWLAAAPLKKFVYTSSTSVYGQNDGSLVKETSPTEPAAETAKILVETEQVLLEAARQTELPGGDPPPGGHLRAGPRLLVQAVSEERGPHRRHRRAHPQHDPPRRRGGAIIAALKSGRPGEVYNVVDDEPVTQLNFFQWLSGPLGKELPPSVPEDPEAVRKRGVTNKKVSNRRLRMELGCQFKYPTFRQGYTAEILRLDRAGELDDKKPSS